MSSTEPKVLKVKNSTDCQKLSGSIVSALSEEGNSGVILVRVIGAGALNQAIKAQILAKETFSKKGKTVKCEPYFEDLPDVTSESGKPITSIVLKMSLENTK